MRREAAGAEVKDAQRAQAVAAVRGHQRDAGIEANVRIAAYKCIVLEPAACGGAAGAGGGAGEQWMGGLGSKGSAAWRLPEAACT